MGKKGTLTNLPPDTCSISSDRRPVTTHSISMSVVGVRRLTAPQEGSLRGCRPSDLAHWEQSSVSPIALIRTNRASFNNMRAVSYSLESTLSDSFVSPLACVRQHWLSSMATVIEVIHLRHSVTYVQ
jgi:hypothetical protein